MTKYRVMIDFEFESTLERVIDVKNAILDDMMNRHLILDEDLLRLDVIKVVDIIS